MKLGTDSPVKTGVAIALAAVAIFLFLRSFVFPSGEQTATPARPARQAGARQVSSLDPTLRTDLLKAEQETKYEGKGRNIFSAQAEIPQPVAPVMTKQPTLPQGPPPPPPINLKFYGFASHPGQPKKVFLSQGDDIFVAGEGDIVNRRYKIVKINPLSIEVEDMLSNNRQSIPLGQS